MKPTERQEVVIAGSYNLLPAAAVTTPPKGGVVVTAGPANGLMPKLPTAFRFTDLGMVMIAAAAQGWYIQRLTADHPHGYKATYSRTPAEEPKQQDLL